MFAFLYNFKEVKPRKKLSKLRISDFSSFVDLTNNGKFNRLHFLRSCNKIPNQTKNI